MKRWIRYKYLMLMRAKGGASMVAKGFSIGLAVEMFTFPTMGLAFFLIFPLNYFFRGSVAGALIGFVFGKIVYIPLAFINNKVGKAVVGHHVDKLVHALPHWLEKILSVNLNLIVGGIIVGSLLGVIMYNPVKWLLQFYTNKRARKRKMKMNKVLHGS